MNWQTDIYEEIPDRLEVVGEKIVDAAYTVHRKLGPGLLEHIYEVCLVHEIIKRNLKAERQVKVPIVYDDLTFDEGLKLDVLVEDKVICELKAVDKMNPVWEAQIISHLKLTKNRLGYLINFNVRNIGKGIKRFVL
ncbi:GxxExxY protein [Gracilimonas sp.]|uniref:GxxExxY protein n=1 Tax=Gracilimonas sp. TaxID=1974203 RepID=UPI0028727564|nr:GxxExxY protein [Gracilimonas sp.]